MIIFFSVFNVIQWWFLILLNVGWMVDLCEDSHIKTPLSKVPTHSTSAHQATNNNILLCNSRHHKVTRLLKLISYDVTLMKINQQISWVLSSVSLVVEFKRWWVLKSKVFGQESTCHQGKIFKKFLRVMTVCQKLGVILESKVVQKLSIFHSKDFAIF